MLINQLVSFKHQDIV